MEPDGSRSSGPKWSLYSTLLRIALLMHCTVTELSACPLPRLTAILGAQGSALSFDYTACHYGGRRMWLACPICCRRVAKIYRPVNESAFACRKCHQLNYRSAQSQGGGSSRVLKKPEKPDQQNGLNGFLHKPEGPNGFHIRRLRRRFW